MVKHISPSSLELYKQCPKKYYYSKIEQLPQPPVGHEAIIGTFAHESLQRFMKLPAAERTRENLTEIVRAQWPIFEKTDEYITLDVTDAQFRGAVSNALVGYLSIENPMEVEVVETELEVICDIDGVPFYGFVDRITKHNGCLTISDYKSGKVPGEKYKEDKLVQPLLYAAALRELGHDICRVELIYVTYGDVIGCIVSDDKMVEVKGILRQVWDDIQAEKFPEKTGPLCAWCPFEDLCPKGHKAAVNYRKYRRYKGDPID